MPAVAKSTHVWSHAMRQQLGSILHTIAQQAKLLQKGVGCTLKQLPAPDAPHSKASPQSHELMPAAMPAHWMSQVTWQQMGSWLHTAVQQGRLSHDGPSCGMQQFPLPLSPHCGLGHASLGPPHSARAVFAHTKSQRVWQHVGSAAHTAAQQDRSLQAGPSCAVQQSPAHWSPQSTPQRLGHSVRAWLAQVASHPALQQIGSAAQTVEQHAWFEHAGARCASQQLPVALPQVGTWSGHAACAICTHTSSHAVSQQKTSCWHTEMQHSPMEQPPFDRGTKHDPAVDTPHPPAQRCSAYSTQNASQPVRQQYGSCAHTVAQQDGSSQ